MYDPDFTGDYDHKLLDMGSAYACDPQPFLTIQTLDAFYELRPEKLQCLRDTFAEQLLRMCVELDEFQDGEVFHPGYDSTLDHPDYASDTKL
ncbi:MAG: uncharacterized protein KVP18_003566 [Porospora cf. gigantea A]|uniref:uncharacterized protein n=1 Tax=Porospora cf. gigantea A TaxID=2853593 RepID=UPI003559E4F2|nr:MAG: hypothetical protein KVP18_003566 [Porospora cf. gigantea A]